MHTPTDPIANVLVCDRNAAARIAASPSTCRTVFDAHRRRRHQRERGHRHRLRECIRQVAGRHDAEAERDQVVQRDRQRAGQAVPADAHGHAVEEKPREHIRRADDRPQQRHVGCAATHEPRERNREDVEPGRIRELVVPGSDRREVVAPAEHVLKAVRMEQRIANRHVRVQQHEELEEETPPP